LWLTANALKIYSEAAHFEIDDEGVPKIEVIVPASARQKAEDALGRADRLLKDHVHRVWWVCCSSF